MSSLPRRAGGTLMLGALTAAVIAPLSHVDVSHQAAPASAARHQAPVADSLTSDNLAVNAVTSTRGSVANRGATRPALDADPLAASPSVSLPTSIPASLQTGDGLLGSADALGSRDQDPGTADAGTRSAGAPLLAQQAVQAVATQDPTPAASLTASCSAQCDLQGDQVQASVPGGRYALQGTAAVPDGTTLSLLVRRPSDLAFSEAARVRVTKGHFAASLPAGAAGTTTFAIAQLGGNEILASATASAVSIGIELTSGNQTVDMFAGPVTVAGRSSAGRQVWLEQLFGGSWRQVAKATADASGTFHLTTPAGQYSTGTVQLRAATTVADTTRYSTTVTITRSLSDTNRRMTEAEGEALLKANGISIMSSGNCSDRTRYGCTSLDTMRATTAAEIVHLRDASGCPVIVTGGTEVGHMTAPISHPTGYKFDAKITDCITTWVEKTGTPIDGARWSINGVVYYNEADHWDVTVDPSKEGKTPDASDSTLGD